MNALPRALAAPLYYGGLRLLRIPAAARTLQTAGRILCYHNVVPDEACATGAAGIHMSRTTFARQMRWLADHYDVLPLREAIARLERGDSLRSVAVIAFDDGYNGVFEHAVPVLTSLGISATVFVVAEAAGRSTGFWWDQPDVVKAIDPERREAWLTDLRGDEQAIVGAVAGHRRHPLPHSHQPASWRTIRAALADGIDIGVHSATHRSLPTVNDVELDREVVGSREIVDRELGIRADLFAYPYGRCDARVAARVRVAGYRAALGLEAGVIDRHADPWCLRRINIPAGISDAAFEAWTAGLEA